MCVYVCSDISQLGDIAEAIQARLDSYKADKRELGTVSHVAIVLTQSQTYYLESFSFFCDFCLTTLAHLLGP